MSGGRTLYDKIVDCHKVMSLNGVVGAGETLLLYVDRTVLNEYTSPQAFNGLREAGRRLWRHEAVLGTVDHVNSTMAIRDNRSTDSRAERQITYFLENGRDFGFEVYDVLHPFQGIEHVVLPDIGWVLPGLVIAAGDSHTTTYGAFGSIGFGIGTSDIEHLLATQCVVYHRLKSMRMTIDGSLAIGVTPKDIIMAVVRQLSASGASGYALEFAGDVIASMGVEGRMTICNMAVECGARAALMQPDYKVIEYISGRERSLRREDMALARAAWSDLFSDPDSVFDREVRLDAREVPPMVSWGTSPDQAVAIDGRVPDPARLPEIERRAAESAIAYMGLTPGTPLESVRIDRAFIGSCTNARLSDLRDAARILMGQRVAPNVQAIISPGSSTVRRAAEAEGLDRIFIDAGFEWRQSGCSMCLAMNDDVLAPGERCASSTNRNFEGRQGSGGRTHLMSPAMVAAAAVKGSLADVREFKISALPA